ncbi:hypothetical protein G5T42_01660 [Microbacterium sp. 4R-513]|uniref:hypothetical protein n=1 Tax=Microbacterium sp. 4R-513 TaxID=2567934 RepID=UPI0013E106EE|nr:hypothetical protein [Microbacterium sp. 4R-513]QIG38340.1 hypothetical protein G5T42_01660 [Microbacterium sp. 4R-513]
MEGLPLYRRTELASWGFGSARILESVANGLLIKVRPGMFSLAESWQLATPEERVVARARALASSSRTPPLFSHETAAALHGLPLLAPDPRKVHVTLDADRPGAAAGVIRHRGEVGSDQIVEVDGLRCTALTRTIADIARTAAFEQAVVVTDAMLRRLCVTSRADYDDDRAAEVRAELRAIVRESAHGRSRAERVLRFADGRAELPGESVSRIRLAQIGFRPARLQVAVPGPTRTVTYYVDFALDDAGVYGEFDGRIKYEDGRLLVQRSPDEIFEREKQREDWIRGTTGRSVVRWGWPHIATAAALAERLAAFGIRPAG